MRPCTGSAGALRIGRGMRPSVVTWVILSSGKAGPPKPSSATRRRGESPQTPRACSITWLGFWLPPTASIVSAPAWPWPWRSRHAARPAVRSLARLTPSPLPTLVRVGIPKPCARPSGLSSLRRQRSSTTWRPKSAAALSFTGRGVHIEKGRPLRPRPRDDVNCTGRCRRSNVTAVKGPWRAPFSVGPQVSAAAMGA